MMEKQIESLLRSKDLKDITNEIVEKVIDNKISDDILREIPTVKLLIATKKIYHSISDGIFIQKAMKVLLELGDVNWKERVELVRDLQDSHSSGVRKILMTVDNLDSLEKCKIFGRLCKLKAYKKIDGFYFLRLTKVIQNAFINDLLLVKKFAEEETKNVFEGDYFSLISLGLVVREHEQTPMYLNHNITEDNQNEILGGELLFHYSLTDTGNLVLKYYEELFD